MDMGKKKMGLPYAIAMMIGGVVGASIFVVPGALALTVGPMAWLSYAVGAAATLFGCFIFAQTGAVIGSSGANYQLCCISLNDTLGFLYVWCNLLGNCLLFAIMSRTTATYLAVLFPELAEYETLVALLVVLIIGLLHVCGADIVSKVQSILVLTLITVVMIFCISGIRNANWDHFTPAFPYGGFAVLQGVVSTYYAFAGMTNIIEMSGDIQKPDKNIPRTVFISLAIVACLYVAMCIALIGVLPTNEITSSTPVIVAAGRILPEWFQYAVVAAAIASCFGTLNAVVGGMSRLVYSLGSVSILPRWAARKNRRGTPVYAICVLTAIGILIDFIFPTAIKAINVSSFYLLFMTIILAFASMRIKAGFPDRYMAAAYKLSGIHYYLWPILMIVTNGALLAIQFVSDSKSSVMALILMPVGLTVYCFRKRKIGKIQLSDIM